MWLRKGKKAITGNSCWHQFKEQYLQLPAAGASEGFLEANAQIRCWNSGSPKLLDIGQL